jgi:hypothetical protein
MFQQLVSTGSVAVGRTDHLGRVLFQHKEKFSSGVFCLVAGLGVMGFGAYVAWMLIHQRSAVAAIYIVLGAAVNFIALALIYTGFTHFARAGRVSSLHELGARIVDRHGAVLYEMRYEDAAILTFDHTRLLTNGEYQFTYQHLQVRLGARTDPPIEMSDSFREDIGLATNYRTIGELETLAYRIAALMAERLHVRVERGETVPWVDRLRIRADGLVVGTKENEELVPWAKIARLDIDQGIFKLRLTDEEKPRVELPTSTKNFYPGYSLAAEYLKKNANVPGEKADEPAQLAETTPSLTIAYANTVEDFLALRLYEYRTNKTKRFKWQIKAWDLSAIIIIPTLVAVVASWYLGRITQETAILGAAGSVLAALLLRPCRGKVLWFLERRKVAAELQAAHLWAQHRRCPDPFLDRRISFDKTGYVVRTFDGAVRANWRALSRLEFFEDYLFLYVGADQLHPERIALMIPARAFGNAEEAHRAFETLKSLHAKASSGK